MATKTAERPAVKTGDPRADRTAAAALIAAVREHAAAHYAEGWDFITEATSDDELAEIIGASRTPAGAIAKAAKVVKLRAEQRATVDAQASGQPAEPKPLNANTLKRAVADAAARTAGDLIAAWNHPEISRDAAISVIARRVNRLPGTTWDDRLGDRPGTTAKTAPVISGAHKEAVAAAMIHAAADLASTWEHDEISRDEATALIAQWMNYLPGNEWDDRLGKRSGAGNRGRAKN